MVKSGGPRYFETCTNGNRTGGCHFNSVQLVSKNFHYSWYSRMLQVQWHYHESATFRSCARSSQRLFFSFRGMIPPSFSTIRSAHSTSDTKTAGLPNFALQASRSVSVTPRAREQLPQEKTGMRFATTFSRSSLRGGQPIGNIAAAVALRMR
jgi:hypothetical protein